MATTQSITHCDVWSEILRYFRIDLVGDDEAYIQRKRRTILAIALTHPDLADVALDELWRSMVSLEPIVRVFNVVGGSTPVLKYSQKMGFWEISLSSNGTNSCFPRARLYLSRVQYLHLATFPPQGESTLLTAISSLVQSSPICPNLQKIFLGPGLQTPVMIYNITLLISPGLQNLVFANTTSSESTSAAIPPLLNLLKCYGVQLREISYRGLISPGIVQTISEFSTLHSATIKPSEPLTGGNIQSLSGLENLTRLDIHLSIFRADVSVGDWLKAMPLLVTLSLSGSWKDIYACIRDRSYGSIQSLSLFIDTPKGYEPPLAQRIGRDAFSHIEVAFPGLLSFSLILSRGHLAQDVVAVSDVLALRERPLEVLELRNLPASLSTPDIIDVLAAWPLLKRLYLVPPTTQPFICEAGAILSYISNHAPKLQGLDLPLDFSIFVTTPISLSLCKCPLQELNLSRAKNLPQHFHDKLTFCQNLTSLLPRLTVVTSPNSNPDGVLDLQAVIRLVQDIASSPPKRHDHLF